MTDYMENMHPYLRSGNRTLRLTEGGPFRAAGGVVPDGLGSEAASSMSTRVMGANSDYNLDQSAPSEYVKDQFADFHNFVHDVYGPVKAKNSRFSANTTTIVTGSAPAALRVTGQNTVMNTDAIRGMALDRSHVTTTINPNRLTAADTLRKRAKIDRQIYENLQRATDSRMDAVRAQHISAKVRGRHARAAVGGVGVGGIRGLEDGTPMQGDTSAFLVALGIVAATGAALWMISR